MRVKLLTGAYVGALVIIVILANGSGGPRLFAPLRSLPFGDKLGHFCLMGLLALLVNLCLSCRRLRLGAGRVLAGSLFVLLVVAAEEFSQIFMRRRSFDPLDLLADSLGILLGGRLACYLKSRKRAASGP